MNAGLRADLEELDRWEAEFENRTDAAAAMARLSIAMRRFFYLFGASVGVYWLLDRITERLKR
jgi:hypothetical protein